jgi:hypothetical protein
MSRELGYKLRKKVKKMKNYLKLSALAAVTTIFVTFTSISGIAVAKSDAETLTDYLSDKNVSFLIVHGEKLTTFGQKSAKSVCKDIKEAGFSVKTIRNYSKDERIETVASCS